MMMTRCKLLLALTLTIVCMYGLAQAEEAPDLTQACSITASYRKTLYRVTDGKRNVPFEGQKGKDTWIAAETPEGQAASALYLVWTSKPTSVNLEVWDDQTQDYVPFGTCGARGMSHEVVDLPENTTRFRLHAPDDSGTLALCEMTVYGAGELPGDVQDWQPTAEKTDLMLVSAHPDDEYIFFGGLVPLYASRGLHVTVVYMTHAGEKRLHELLDGLWTAGVREYPVVLDFPDKFSRTLDKGYTLWGEDAVLDALADVIDRCEPEVVVTHDLNGEYGHGAHRVSGDACLRLIRDGVRTLTWQPKKLYLHLYEENPIRMDWETPLEALGGRTPLEAAREAFKCHKSQQGFDTPLKNGKIYKFEVASGGLFDNACFGLAYTSVGPDTLKNDLMENIELEDAL